MDATGPQNYGKARAPNKASQVRRSIGLNRIFWDIMIGATSRVRSALSKNFDRDCEVALLFSLLGLALSLAYAMSNPEGLALLGAY